MQRIGVLYNPLSERSRKLSKELVSWLVSQDIPSWRGTSEEGRDHPDALHDVSLLIALGGDGTMLRAARLAIPLRIPILTVALGHLNFMAELRANELPEAIHTLRSGGGWYEERALVHASLLRADEHLGSYIALNEIVLSRGHVSRTLTIDVLIDDIPLTTYRADGAIVSTATGSTAYALSAGGPIVDPRSRSLVLVPIAAHLTAVPSIVLHEDTVVKMILRSQCNAALSVDGRDDVPVQVNDTVVVQRCEQVCKFARVRSAHTLYATFVSRLRRE